MPNQTAPKLPAAGNSLAGPVRLRPLREISARRRLFIGAALAGGLIGGAIAFSIPNTYNAMAVIMSPQKEQSAASALIGQLGSLGAVAGADLGLKSPSDLYIGLLGSRTIADHLVEKFSLQSVYRTKTAVDTRAALKKRTRFSSGKDSLIRIDVEDTDPARAAELANGYVSELNSQNKTFAMTDAGQRRVFLEKQLASEKTALAEAEDAMKKMQSQSGLIQLDGQTTVAIGSLASLRAQITAGEVGLERLRLGATPQNPEMLRAESELGALRNQLRKLEKSSERGNPLLPVSALPDAGLEYVRRLRDLKYHEFLFEMLSKQYEAARLDERKAAPALQVVDTAIPPDKKSGPHRALITLLGCFCGLATATFVMYYQIYQRPLGA